MSRTKYIALDYRVLVVAKEGTNHDWSAYIGAVKGSNHDEEWQEVASNGSKLPKAVAEVLFPDFKALSYRE